jgi:tetratricopeptide (TPR) repeat protein
MDIRQGEASRVLDGKRVVLVGRLASMARRDAAQLLRQHGATVVDRPDPSVHLAVVGEEELALPDAAGPREWFDAPTRAAVDAGSVEVLSETALWQRLGLVDREHDIQRLYTPAMLAELLGIRVTVVRRWHRRGLIHPVREVRRLPYFDFREVATARRLAELLAAGVSPAAIERKLGQLSRYLPHVQRPLAQLSVIVHGKDILLREGDGLIEPGGQLRFDFDAAPADEFDAAAMPDSEPRDGPRVVSLGLPVPAEADDEVFSVDRMTAAAAELEETGQLEAAADMYRAVMAAEGPRPEPCFLLAELLYRMGDLCAARERYYMAIELDEDYVEARANLGCVLAEQEHRELAVAAFEGALRYHPDYADAHYHLARTFDELGRREDAEEHWRAFLALAPDSPWADHARSRLAEDGR